MIFSFLLNGEKTSEFLWQDRSARTTSIDNKLFIQGIVPERTISKRAVSLQVFMLSNSTVPHLAVVG